MSRILCAWSPTWAIANWRRRNPSDSPVEPFVLIETVRAVRRLSAVSEAARRLERAGRPVPVAEARGALRFLEERLARGVFEPSGGSEE